MNPLAQVLVSKEEEEELIRIEALKRRGHKFIRVIYKGPEGDPTRIRFHGAYGIKAYSMPDENQQQAWHTKVTGEALTFQWDRINGQIYTDLLDLEHNRFYLAKQWNGGQLGVEDQKVALEIQQLINVPYRVELDRKEELKKQIGEIQQELKEIDTEEAQKKSETKEIEKEVLGTQEVKTNEEPQQATSLEQKPLEQQKPVSEKRGPGRPRKPRRSGNG